MSDHVGPCRPLKRQLGLSQEAMSVLSRDITLAVVIKVLEDQR